MTFMRSAFLTAGLSLSVSIVSQSALAQTPPTPEQREAGSGIRDAQPKKGSCGVENGASAQNRFGF